MGIKFRPALVQLYRLAVGPVRTTHEMSLSLLGGMVGAVVGVIIGVAVLTIGTALDDFWRTFPPPLTPFVVVPAAFGAVAGLRFTTDLTRPARLTATPLVFVSLGSVALIATVAAVLAMLHATWASAWPDAGYLLRETVVSLIFVPVFAVAFFFVPGSLAFPALVPVVWFFAFLMRRLDRLLSKPQAASGRLAA